MIRLRQLMAPLLFAAVFGYFGYHLVNGDRGLLAMIHLQTQVHLAEQNLVETKATQRIWDTRVSLLRTGSLDPDMLDERARSLLHVARPDEIVIFMPTR